ncbi:DUF4382 domain-containing protein [Flavobacterium sp. SORGH_AS_0622]|uniref:DUF4382 domain-containing protein n=1 Tax=Flavobacterium sp. SORGH_AS_0622 TaxID=3041772 RepID=UPI002784A291|nr:DUF4382 domain-containing protein [Flavobacterium sp. SORGH_AS_0622]MDQ1165656.1 hypothetical protein [Flavobacterium sp. SORGH_AS_0622]
MKTANLKFRIFLLASLSALLLASCSNSDGSDSSQTSKVSVRMTDAPGDYDQVNVEVLDVKIKSNSEAGEDGWVSIGNIKPGVYNLLDLTGGVNVLLADNEVPSGYLGQIRLILGDKNTVVKDGVTYPLVTPSAQQSGLKLKVNQTLTAGATYDFLLDFDVEHSVVVEAGGSGSFNLHPVIRISTTATSGIIKGMVTPFNLQSLVSVQVGDTTVSAYADESGAFQLNGIPAGTYSVTITPDASSQLSALVVPNVVVVNGQITNMNTLTLK